MKGLKIVFMGSPEFAVPSLEKLIDSPHRIVGIVTQPDKPRGRGRKEQPTAVKKIAIQRRLSPILQPERLKDQHFLTQLGNLQADIFVVIAFRLLPEVVFNLPPLGTINLHPSLLPAYRGAAPLNWAIINGEKKTGLTIMQISEVIDGGGILLQEEHTILPHDTAGDLHDRLSLRGADLLLNALEGIAKNQLKPVQQNGNLATPAPKINRGDCHISFRQSAQKVKNWIHGLSPVPAAFAHYEGEVIKFYRAAVVDEIFVNEPPGTILDSAGKVLVACSPGIVEILSLQRQGKKILTAEDFLRGFSLKPGSLLN